MSKSKLSTSKLSDKLQLSTKVDSKDRFRRTISNQQSPKSMTSNPAKSRERFDYANTEKLFKTLIKITSVTPLSGNNLAVKKSYSNGLNLKTVGSGTSPTEVKHHRYKRNYSYQNIDKYRSITESPVCKLTETLSKYVEEGLTREDFYKTLLKNNIDPESTEVNRILQDLEKSGVGSTQPAITKLVKIRNISTYNDKLADSLVVTPKKQLLTSFESEDKFKKGKSKSKQEFQSASKYNTIEEKNSTPLTKVEDDFGFNHSSKRRFGKEELGTKHHNESENLLSHSIHSKKESKAIKGITIKNYNKSNDAEEIVSDMNISHKDKKIAFMQNSTALTQEKTPIDNTKLSEKKAGTVMQNLSSKDTFSFFDSKHIKNVKEKNIINEHKVNRPMKYKNVVSEQNINAVSVDKKKQIMMTPTKETKILGLFGKGKSELSNTEVNQLKTSVGNLFEWNVKKTKHEIASPSKPSNPTKQNTEKNFNPAKDNVASPKESGVKSNRVLGNKGFLSLLKK